MWNVAKDAQNILIRVKNLFKTHIVIVVVIVCIAVVVDICNQIHCKIEANHQEGEETKC